MPFADVQHAGRVPDFRDFSQTPRSSNIPRIVDTTEADNYWIPAMGPFGGSQVDPRTGEVISTEEAQRRNRGIRPPDVINTRVLRPGMMPQGADPSMTTNLPVPVAGNQLGITIPRELDLATSHQAIFNSGGRNAVRMSVVGVGDLPLTSPSSTPWATPPSSMDSPVQNSAGIPVVGPTVAELEKGRSGLKKRPPPPPRVVPPLPGRPTETELLDQLNHLRPSSRAPGVRLEPKTPGTVGTPGHRPGPGGSTYEIAPHIIASERAGDRIARSETERLAAEGHRQAGFAYRTGSGGGRNPMLRDAHRGATVPASHTFMPHY